MKKTSYILALLVAASAVLLAGCAKESGFGTEGSVLSFGSQMSITKGELKESISTFKVRGFNGTAPWFPQSGEQTVIIGSSDSFPTYRWKNDEIHSYYAYANLPASGASASIESTGVTLTYSAVPQSAAEQTDILLGKYSGTGYNGKATIVFEHALTSVTFVAGTITNATITGISLGGLYTSGSVTLESGTLGAWKNCTVGGQEMTGNLDNNFILIPQNLAANAVELTVYATVASEPVELVATLSSDNWEAGKTNTYTINYNGGDEIIISPVSVTHWDSNSGGGAGAEEMDAPLIIRITGIASDLVTLEWDPVPYANIYNVTINLPWGASISSPTKDCTIGVSSYQGGFKPGYTYSFDVQAGIKSGNDGIFSSKKASVSLVFPSSL